MSTDVPSAFVVSFGAIAFAGDKVTVKGAS
jgi:hypothetical protein